MCMEDIRIQRKTEVAWQFLPVSNLAPVQLLPADPLRVSLILGSSSTGRVSFGNVAGIVAAQGLIINTNGAPITLSIRDYGQVVTGEWWGVASVANVSIFVITTRLSEM